MPDPLSKHGQTPDPDYLELEEKYKRLRDAVSRVPPGSAWVSGLLDDLAAARRALDATSGSDQPKEVPVQ